MRTCNAYIYAVLQSYMLHCAGVRLSLIHRWAPIYLVYLPNLPRLGMYIPNLHLGSRLRIAI